MNLKALFVSLMRLVFNLCMGKLDMRVRVLIFISLLTLGSCSSMSKPKKIKVLKDRPEWLFEPDKGCKLDELCAVGEAPGSLSADIAARKNLAKIFETKVKSTLDVTTTAKSTVKDQVVSGEVDETVREKIQEQTEQVLKGVQIREIYEDQNSYFALAVLNKRLASERIASEVEALDIEMRAHLNDGRRSSLNKALKLYHVRNSLNERHQFLAERRVPSSISLNSILSKKSKKRALGTRVLVHFEEVGGISEVNNLIISHLLENDFKVITDSKRNPEFFIIGSLSKEEQHMNVRGFKRYRFVLELKSQNSSAEKIGALEFNTTQTGRSLQHAYENAMPEIRSFLDEKLDELNID